MTDRVTGTELAEIAGRRSSTWWLLSRLVIEPPQEPWLSELEAMLATVDAEATAPLGAESASLLAALRGARSLADGFTALAVDRTSLLAGVLHKESLPAPYESTALGLPMNSDLVIEVAECYREAGLEDVGTEHGPPDFLGTELRFMALLGYRELQAHQARDSGLAAQWLLRQQRFLDEHILRWVPAHCERLNTMAKTPFYAALALLLGRACLLDRGDLAQVSEWMAE